MPRWNKIIVTGIKKDGVFLGKKYKSTKHHLVELITKVEKDSIFTKKEREEVIWVMDYMIVTFVI